MTLQRFTLIIILLSLHLGSAAQSSVGLIAHWPFNGNSNDVTGNGHNGTAHNTTNAAGKSGAANTAYFFNGTSSYITAPYRSDLNVTQYSICAVIKPMDYYKGQCQGNDVLRRGVQYASGSYGFHYFDNAYDSDCNTVDTAHNVFIGMAGDTYYNDPDLYYPSPIVVNTWYSVVVTFDGSKLKTYVNGVLKATAPAQGGSLGGSSSDSIFIGSSYNGMSSSYPYWINAYLDDLRLYNRVLADTEIVEYYTNVTLPSFNTSLCADKAFNLAYNIEGSFKAGNIFTAELSDATGSFTTPTVIGTAAATAGGVISCTIPVSVTPGSGYLIRVKASNPAKTSDAVNVRINSSATPTITLAAAPGTTVGINTTVTMGNTINFTTTATNGGTAPVYTWKKNSTVITGATGSIYSAIAGTDFVSGDTITATVKADHNCPTIDNASAKLRMLIGMDVAGINTDFNTAIYPNPNNGNFTLKGYIPVNGNLQLSVFNSVGQAVYSKEISVNKNSINEQISLSGLGAGIYNVKLQTTTGSKTMRITVQ